MIRAIRGEISCASFRVGPSLADWAASRSVAGLVPAAPANKLPIAVITATPDAGDPLLDVTFSSAGTAVPDGTISSYSWDFGDGLHVVHRGEPDLTR